MSPVLPRILAVSALLAALGASSPLVAGGRHHATPLVDIAAVDRDTGAWLPPTRHRGDDWIEGRPGHRYGLRLTNVTGGRVLAVVSVDGINVVTGQTAATSQTGYVLEPWQTLQIDGWRKSLSQVAQFVFTDIGDSYAARTGRAQNVGVIGVAVFEEARPWREPPAAIAESQAGKEAAVDAAAPSRRAVAQAQSMQSSGTGHGAREHSFATRTTFQRATTLPAQVLRLRYDDRDGLVARGVVRSSCCMQDFPHAFPGGFAPDPPGDFRN
ncbi:hypothetical protein [Lysobacter sp.]|uniref:hypothetical protein n=1 Tax=Lysobacter sp. TaxID=72226 RepID=UPI002D3CEC75|nr:hypothetical protein [Lysobacter sp.]HZX77142.1 hypothetical protein [Lysobacter sp.]